MRSFLFPILLCFALCGLAADRVFSSFASVKPILEQHRAELPSELRNPDEAKWNAWARSQDKAIRTRLDQGDLDSLVNLLLFGTSFTKQPRVKIETITDASRSGLLRARVDDLVSGLANPGDNERLLYMSGLLRRLGVEPGTKTGVFLLQNLQRVLEERKRYADREQAATRELGGAAKDPAQSLEQRSGLFRDRGVSLDTSILPNFSMEQTLRDLKNRGLLREGQVTRVAVVGPGLDLINKNDEYSYDYYPEQTLQPFALYDSLLRLQLAKPGALEVSVFDISSAVIQHLQGARERAKKNRGYVIQLPHDVGRAWPPELEAYWRTLGDQVGAAVAPLKPPAIFPGLVTRAVQIKPEVVLACVPADLNVVLERISLPREDQFDVIVGTNIFLYYDAFEQTLALENIGSMLKPGGFLLANDRLSELREGAMKQAGFTDVKYGQGAEGIHDTVVWYRKTP